MEPFLDNIKRRIKKISVNTVKQQFQTTQVLYIHTEFLPEFSMQKNVQVEFHKFTVIET